MDETGAQVFVKIGEYKDVVAVMELIKNKLQEARNSLNKLNELRNEEERELKEWGNSLDDIEQRIGDIDKRLIEPTEI